MALGIERRKIFWDDKDRSLLLERLALILEETQTQCYAWTLLPNHFHLLLRTGATPLSTVMKCLIPETAANGSTFAYRRIAFSQFRPGIEKATTNPENPVDPVKNKSLAEKTVEDVLQYFGKNLKEARRRYRQFVEKGIKHGRREDLQGGGLIRSSGGDKAGLLGLKKEDREKSDQRILGSGGFVGAVLQESERLFEKKYKSKRSIEELIEVVAEQLDISPELICSGSRKRLISDARVLLSYVAVEETGHKTTDVARVLGIKRVSVHHAVKKGKKVLENLPSPL